MPGRESKRRDRRGRVGGVEEGRARGISGARGGEEVNTCHGLNRGALDPNHMQHVEARKKRVKASSVHFLHTPLPPGPPESPVLDYTRAPQAVRRSHDEVTFLSI